MRWGKPELRGFEVAGPTIVAQQDQRHVLAREHHCAQEVKGELHLIPSSQETHRFVLRRR